MKKYRSVIIGILISMMSTSIYAQKTLSISDAIEQGLAANYDILIEDKQVEKTTNNNSWGEAGRWPSIDFNINQNNIVSDNIETATPFQLKDKIISNSVSPNVQLNWTLFNGFKINISKYRLEKLQEESEGNADIIISNTIQGIILGYYKVVLEQRRLEEFGKQLELSRDKMEYLQTKADIGGAVTSDLLLEEGNYLTDSTNFINQELSYRQAMRNLNVLLAQDPETVLELSDPLEIKIKDYDYLDLINQMESDNVDLKKQYLSQAILQYDVGIRKAEKQPVLYLNSYYNYNKNRNDLSKASFPSDGGFVSGPSDPLTSITGTYAANFTLSFNLFNGGRINRAIQNARIQEDIGNIQIDRLKTSLRKDLANAYDQYNIRRQIFGVNQRKKEVSELNLNISDDKYKNGSISSFDFRTVQNNQLVASIQELQSLYNLIDSNVELMRLTGGIIRVYKN
jgi:outer membrane protein TolC